MAQIRADEIARVLREEIENYEQTLQVAETGYVVTVGDGIARLHGLDKVMAGELIEFPHNVSGIALNLDEDEVGAVMLGEYTEIKEGDEVRRTGRIMRSLSARRWSAGSSMPSVAPSMARGPLIPPSLALSSGLPPA